jgi:5-methylcytosine-specific restriction enzyme A
MSALPSAVDNGQEVSRVRALKHSTRRRIPGVWSTPRPLGPNGEKLCYNCGGLLPKGRPYNCSSKCSEEWRCKTSPSYIRWKLKQRDHGICVLCQTDTIALQKEYHQLPKYPDREARDHFLKVHGIPFGRSSSDWWDADHIIPVIEGGGECDLSNLRTLCIPCHRKETRELRRRLKEARDPNMRLDFQSANEQLAQPVETGEKSAKNINSKRL